MTFGFALAIGKTSSLPATDLNHDNGHLPASQKTDVLSPSSQCTVFLNLSTRNCFVATAQADQWFVVSIGTNHTDGTPADFILEQLVSTQETGASSNAAASLILPDGQYVALAYNIHSHNSIAVTDPSGIRSLFSSESEDTRYLASSISMLKAIRPKHYWAPDETNQSFLLRYGYSLPNRSVFEDISEIVPNRIVFTKNDDLTSTLHTHVPKSEVNATTCSSSDNQVDLQAKLLNCLTRACSQQVGDNKKVGVLLGGFDSALVASLLVRLGVEVETYSFHYESERYNQPMVEELTSKLGIKHHWVEITPELIRSGLNRYASSANWPTLWLNYVIQTQFLCERMSKDGMQSCFSGDGCDTAFMGYPSTYRRGRIYQMLPKIGVKTTKALTMAFHTLKLEALLGHVGRVMLSLISAANQDADDRALYSFQLFDPHLQKILTNKDSALSCAAEQHFSKVLKRTSALPYERKLYLAKSFISPNRCKLVSSSDTSGLAMHSPYMHQCVTEFTRTLPVETLRPEGIEDAREGKYLLMKMAENTGLLPRNVIYQPKLAAISSPIDSWLATELRDFSLNKLDSLPFDYSKSYVKSLLNEKWFEKLYKSKFSNDGVVSVASSLLLTYACFFE